MLRDFFKFYSDFDFDKRAICILTGDPNRPRRPGGRGSGIHSPFTIDMVNPLEPDKNVCEQVKPPAVNLLKNECLGAYRNMLKNIGGEMDLGEIIGETNKSMKINIKSILEDDGEENNVKKEKVPAKINEDVENVSYSEEKRRLTQLKKASERPPKDVSKSGNVFEQKF